MGYGFDEYEPYYYYFSVYGEGVNGILTFYLDEEYVTSTSFYGDFAGFEVDFSKFSFSRQYFLKSSSS